VGWVSLNSNYKSVARRLCVVCASPPKEAPLTHARAACGAGRIGRIQNRNVLEEDEVED